MDVTTLAEAFGLGMIPLIWLIVAGYFGYFIAYHGLETPDKFIKILVFVLPVGLMAIFFGWADLSPLVKFAQVAMGFMLSIALGFIWRKWGRHSLTSILAKADIMHKDGYDSVFDVLDEKAGTKIGAIRVTLVDDTIPTTFLSNSDKENYLLQNGRRDKYGNIRLYVDTISDAKGRIKDKIPKSDNFETVTYVKGDSIKTIEYDIEN
jgi:hypothetical protein